MKRICQRDAFFVYILSKLGYVKIRIQKNSADDKKRRKRRVMKKMKRLTAALLAIAVSAMTFTGCANQTSGETTKAPETTQGVESTDAATQAPEVTEPVEEVFTYPIEGADTLTLFAPMDGNMKANHGSFAETDAAKWIREATGVTVEYEDQHVDFLQDLNLMVSTGEYTDMIALIMTNYTGGAEQALDDGAAIPLNDIIDKYCPNLKAYLEAHPEIDKQIKTDDGIYYMFPSVSGGANGYTFGGYCRQDWLDEMGEELPTTVDGWYQLLVKVRDKYDVVPFTIPWGQLLKYSPLGFAYGIGGNSSYKGFAYEDGKVVYEPATDAYKNFLMTAAKWYDEGLLETDLSVITTAQVNAKMINGEAFLSAGWLGSAMQTVQTSGSAANPDFKLSAIPTMVLNEGDVPVECYCAPQFNAKGVTITEDCENVELAARYLDYGYSQEGSLLYNFGIEGESYTMVEGKPTFTDDVLVNYPEGWNVQQSVVRYAYVGSQVCPAVQDENYYPQTLTGDYLIEAQKVWKSVQGVGNENQFPNVGYTLDESSEYATIISNLETYRNEMAVSFILGTVSFDEWDTYLETLESYGLSRAVEINEAALARYNER